MRVSTRVIIALAIFASLISFLKFNYCVQTGFSTPSQYIHACYSDIPALYGERALDQGVWPYSSGNKSVEYPVIQGIVMWATAIALPDGPIKYFIGSAFLLALLFIAIVLIAYRIKPEFSYLLPLAPAAIASLYINWDLWAIVTMMFAIYWFDRGKFQLSALALGISISTKFLPIFLLIPVALIFFRRNKIKNLFKYLTVVSAAFVAINLPIALTTFDGWWRFYSLNFNRGSDWGSIWYALSNLGFNPTHQNYLAVLVLLIEISAFALFYLQTVNVLKLADIALFVMVIVMAASKVYSPQYVLWLTPLAVIALVDKRDIPVFWFWQGAEFLYHLAIWQHLATVTGARFGLPVGAYSLASLIRIGASIFLVVHIARRQRNSGTFPHQFLLSTGESYP